MQQISEIGRKMLAFQSELAAEYGYKPIEPNFFLGDIREKFEKDLPNWCKLSGDYAATLFTLDSTILCKGYNRIVIGDYGAFVEISPEQLCADLRCKPGQEYRYGDERFSKNVKYLWLTASDKSNCKIYLQKKGVEYADYIPGMYYISPYEVIPANKLEE